MDGTFCTIPIVGILREKSFLFPLEPIAVKLLSSLHHPQHLCGRGRTSLYVGLRRLTTVLCGLINTRHKQIRENEMLHRMSLTGLAIIPTFVSALNRTIVFSILKTIPMIHCKPML
jgi:hypothetical protein